MSVMIRPMKKEEVKYSYPQSTQICGQTGCIGYQGVKPSDTPLIGLFFDNCPEGFDADLIDAIETLRHTEIFVDMFKEKRTIRQFIENNPYYRINGNHGDECGVTVETDDYTYLIRFIPSEDDSDIVYISCYKRSPLESHINNAKRGIRFINSQYKELFIIEDGGKIIFERPGDDPKEMICRYIDDYHADINENIYHICQFAEMCENIGAKCVPVERNENMKSERHN